MSENSIIDSNVTNQENTVQQVLPNSTAVLVLGIISIAACFCYGLPGLILGIIALILAGQARKLYNESPQSYTKASYSNMNAGRVCAIITVILSSIFVIGLIIYIAIVGFIGFSAIPWENL